MLCGVYNLSGRSARELEVLPRLQRHAAGSELLVRGSLAIAGSSSLRSAESDGISCTMEGCLYQPGDLARELRLDTTDNAELVARAYQRFGADVLSRLRGRYSVVIWDSVREQGVLTCDLLATKALFMWRGTGWLLFASELHDLLSVVPSRPGPDPIGFTMWLGGGGLPEGRTLYAGVSRLGPGELIDFGRGSAQTREYWRPRYAGTIKATRAELADGLRDELQRSAGRRLSPRTSGVVLSGGLDSSIVAAAASRSKPPAGVLRTYSAVFPGEDFDESEKVRDLTTSLGIEPAAFRIEPQGTLWLALQHTKRWQMPLVGAGALIDMPIVAEAARDGAEVVLDGQTGDEVLGFAPFLVADRLSRGRVLAALKLADSWPLGRRTTRSEKLWILRTLGLKGAAPYRLGQFVRDHRDPGTAGPTWLLPSLRRQYVELEDRWAWKVGASGPRWWRFLADVLIKAPHQELRIDYLRHRAAGVGVVNESPLYDADLIDYCLRLPPELAFDSRFDRPLAREAMRGVVPEKVRLQSQKAVFSSFCLDALAGADSPGIARLITAPDAELGAYVDMAWVKKLWHEGRPRTGDDSTYWGSVVWRLAAAEAWLQLQAKPEFLDEMLADPDVPAPSIRRVALSPTSTFSGLAPAHDPA